MKTKNDLERTSSDVRNCVLEKNIPTLNIGKEDKKTLVESAETDMKESEELLGKRKEALSDVNNGSLEITENLNEAEERKWKAEKNLPKLIMSKKKINTAIIDSAKTNGKDSEVSLDKAEEERKRKETTNESFRKKVEGIRSSVLSEENVFRKFYHMSLGKVKLQKNQATSESALYS